MATKRFLSKLVLLLVSILLVSFLIVGCSSNTTTTPVNPTTSAPTTAAPTTSAPTTAAPSTTIAPTTFAPTSSAPPSTQAIKKGGTLKIIEATSPSGLGYVPDILKPEAVAMASPAVETLYRMDKTGQSQPWLATDHLKYESATNSYLMTIKKGIKFQDGTDFDAAAVKWNLDQSIGKRTDVKSVKSVDVVDSSTVRINLSTFDNGLETQLSRYCGLMFSPTYFQKNGEEGTKNYPVGTGPFKFVSFTRDVNLKYTRWDGYWQAGKPYLDNIEFVFIADPMVRLASFQAGEADVLTAVEAKDAKKLKDTGKYNFDTCMGTLWGLAGDGSHPDSPFAKIEVRQALEYAVNRDPVVNSIGQGYWASTDQPVAKTQWGYNTTPSPYKYDPAKAKALLAAAGYPNGLGLPMIVQNEPASAVDLMTAILAQLNDAGFNLKLQVVDPGAFSNYVIKTGWNNTLLCWNYVEGADSSSILVFGFSSMGFPYRSTYYAKEVDDIIKQIPQTTDFAQKKALTEQAMGLIRDKYCELTTICRTTNIAAKKSSVHNDGFFAEDTFQTSLWDCWIDK
jgi:peptide/nickel transport system substrate-binding protein